MNKVSAIIPIGIGYYTVPDAARLLGIPALNIRRWLGGYAFTNGDASTSMPPLWHPELPRWDNHIELSFRDLIELRFVKAFLDRGLTINIIRRCLDYARECVGDDRPFSTRQFKTDGKTIFLNSAKTGEKSEMLDLKRKQYVIAQVIERSFKDLDIAQSSVSSWRPYKGKRSIVIDPQRSFGQPIANDSGVPTIALAQAVEAEGSLTRAAELFEVSPAVVRDALMYERSLEAA